MIPSVPRHAIGIVQGRLLPPVGGRVQAFPGDGWEGEFALAEELGYTAMELTIEMASFDIHPIRTPDGRATLRRLADDHGVVLAGLCCDTVMEQPLTVTDKAARAKARDMLRILLDCGAETGLPMIELPMLGPNSLKRAPDPKAFADLLDEALDHADEVGIDILVETDLDGRALARFIDLRRHPRLGINYDTGNSTWFGFDPEDEIPHYHRHIRNVHIKDCTRADYSRPLGTGETRFDAIFALLGHTSYGGGFVIQAARQSDDVAAAGAYLDFTRDLVHRYLTAESREGVNA
ncbi:MAG: sugar phosphate isomerase/epimerase [Alphaproteobacteria bacterium]